MKETLNLRKTGMAMNSVLQRALSNLVIVFNKDSFVNKYLNKELDFNMSVSAKEAVISQTRQCQ